MMGKVSKAIKKDGKLTVEFTGRNDIKYTKQLDPATAEYVVKHNPKKARIIQKDGE